MSIVDIDPAELRSIVGAAASMYVMGSFYGGSRVIVDPHPTDTDCDIVLLVENLWVFENKIAAEWRSPFEHKSDYDGDGDTFRTYRCGEYNLMVFEDPTEFGAVKGATALAKHMNIKEKSKRYKLFETIRSPWR